MTDPIIDPLSDPRAALKLIRAEFDEMPGMHLTLSQASRLWRLPERRCFDLLQTLVAEGYLFFDTRSGYARRQPAIRQRNAMAHV